MIRYVLKRLIQVVPLVVLVLLVNFSLIHLAPGDPASALAGEQATQEYIEELREEYGLDEPLYRQFFTYVQLLVQGDMGFSLFFRRPVSELIAARILPTLLLVFAAEIPAIVLGTVIGAYLARHRDKAVDQIGGVASLVLYSLPVFWTGMMLILIFSLQLGWLPTSGMSDYTRETSGIAGALDVARHLVLPSLALGLYLLPKYVRLARSSVVSVMREPYITTARAVGYSETRVFLQHGLRNALLPSISAASISLGLTFSGALLVETVFAWPGMGQLVYTAVFQRDYPVLMGVFLVSALTVAIVSVIADFVMARVDPRVIYG